MGDAELVRAELAYAKANLREASLFSRIKRALGFVRRPASRKTPDHGGRID